MSNQTFNNIRMILEIFPIKGQTKSTHNEVTCDIKGQFSIKTGMIEKL